jgi:hypothetical protein
MADLNKLGTFIHGIGATEDLDSSGERILIKGIDISTLTKDGLFVWEHFQDVPSQSVGKILYAKKIFKLEDCDNGHHKKFWKLAGEKPYLYVGGILFDKFGHAGAIDCVAQFKFDQVLDKDKTKQTMNLSIHGGKLGDKKNPLVKNAVARKMAITTMACNKRCVAEILENPEDNGLLKENMIEDVFKKCEELGMDLTKDEKKYYTSLANPSKMPKSPQRNYVPTPKASAMAHTPSGAKQNRPATPFKPTTTIPASQITPNTRLKTGTRIEYKKPASNRMSYKDSWKSEMSSMHKAIVASCGVGAPEAKNNGEALAKVEEAKLMLDQFEGKDELIAFLKKSQPQLTDDQVYAIALTAVYCKDKTAEEILKELT